jgi:hypothetical protein
MDKAKLLNLMRFWCFGTFVIVFAAMTVYIGLFVSWTTALAQGFPIWGMTAALCVIWYYAYKFYMNRKG